MTIIEIILKKQEMISLLKFADIKSAIGYVL